MDSRPPRINPPQEQRLLQAGLLLARADANDENSSAGLSAASPKGTVSDNGNNNGTKRALSPAAAVRGEGPGTETENQEPGGGEQKGAEGAGREGGGARQAQLASLLSKAEQYSMFIRQSQVRSPSPYFLKTCAVGLFFLSARVRQASS